ncbi:MAG: hypothetical protein RLZZ596_2022 [Pseudomonadota bacterium]|jgi:LysR family nitrogen assimilation transcriptional regulator
MLINGHAISFCYPIIEISLFLPEPATMNLRALRYFVAIADAGSLTAASASIRIAQPALTRQLRELEADLEVQLFQRLPRGVRLTQAGVTLYESAKRILAEAQRVRQQLAQGKGQASRTVSLGVSPTLARVLLPGLFESCHRSLEGILFQTREAFTPTLLDWLDRGIIDMAVVTNPQMRRELALQPLLGEPFVLAGHRALGIGPVISVEQLEQVPLLMTSLHRGLIEQQLMPLGRKLRVEAEIDSVDSICELIHRGEWATLMPVSVFKNQHADSQVLLSEVSGVQLNRLLVLASRVDAQDNPNLAVIQELLLAEFSRLTQGGIFSLAKVSVRGA